MNEFANVVVDLRHKQGRGALAKDGSGTWGGGGGDTGARASESIEVKVKYLGVFAVLSADVGLCGLVALRTN